MIHRHLRVFLSVLVLGLLLAVGTGVFAQDNAMVRFVHAIPGAATVDIYVDGELTATNVEFGGATAYINIPAAQHQITVTPVGATTSLWEQNFTPGAAKAYTLVASSFDEPVEFTVYEDLLEALPLGEARFTTIHAIADGPAVDVVLDDGRPLVLEQTYDQPFGTLDVPVFSYNLAVVPTGESVDNAILTLDDVALNTGTSYMLLLYGTAANPQSTLLSATTQAESADSGFLRLVHAVPDAPAVDIYVGDAGVLAATLSNPADGSNSTGYIAVPAGDYSVELRAAGTEDTLLTTDVSVNSGEYTSAVALGTADDLTIRVLNDNVASLAANEALLRVINAGTGAISTALSDGTTVATDVAAGEDSGFTALAPALLSVEVSGEGGNNALTDQPFYGGVFYDLLALDDSVVVNQAALAQGIGSAPGASSATLVAAEPTLPAPVVEPTAAPAAVEPTAAPAQPPTPAPIAVPTEAAPTGRVFNLNVDANLQLRQYPSSDALSLGVVPFGTIFTVNGREGELAEIFISATQIPPDYEYVDPVSLLPDEDTDLNPEETWLNVTYNTPDGGTIDAWVRADFIDVRDTDGDQLPLRELETVPGNRPGESRNTDIQSPQAQEDVVTVRVINLDASANLNVRRTPETTGEVLAQLPLNTVAEYVGSSEDGEWIYLRYAAPEGVTTAGWSSTAFLELMLNGEATDVETLEMEGLYNITDLSQRGSQTVGAAPVAAPTVDPTIDAVVAEVALDPGANLNLRRNPEVNAEVLAQIPSGTQLIVSERTEDAQWLNVTYEGVEGWIAAQTDDAVFVRLSFNGAPFTIDEVPVTASAG